MGNPKAQEDPYVERNELHSVSASVSVKKTRERDEFLITISMPKMKGLWSEILRLLEDHSLEVIQASFSTTKSTHFHSIHAKILSSCATGSEELARLLEELILGG